MSKETLAKMVKLAAMLDSEESLRLASTLVFRGANGRDPLPVIDAFHQAMVETWNEMISTIPPRNSTY
jgi:hypothetical protein